MQTILHDTMSANSPKHDDGTYVLTPRFLERQVLRLPYGEGWAEVCSEKTLDPMTATADDVFGRSPEGDMWDADGDRVLLLNDEGWQYIENMPDLSIDEDADLRDIAQLQSVTLTDAEWSVIDAVADHGSSYGYAKRVGERLGMNSGSVRMHLSNVRQKVLTNATN